MIAAYCTGPDTLDAVRADLDAMLADAGRARHMRRQLETAAEHGVALLAALDLPRLVTPDFVTIDRAGIGDMLDLAIAVLDALDGDPEAEPWLGWTGAGIGAVVLGDTLDRELEGEHDEDCGDREPYLGAPERHDRQLRWAAGGHLDVELVNEDDDPGEIPWWERPAHPRIVKTAHVDRRTFFCGLVTLPLIERQGDIVLDLSARVMVHEKGAGHATLGHRFSPATRSTDARFRLIHTVNAAG